MRTLVKLCAMALLAGPGVAHAVAVTDYAATFAGSVGADASLGMSGSLHWIGQDRPCTTPGGCLYGAFVFSVTVGATTWTERSGDLGAPDLANPIGSSEALDTGFMLQDFARRIDFYVTRAPVQPGDPLRFGSAWGLGAPDGGFSGPLTRYEFSSRTLELTPVVPPVAAVPEPAPAALLAAGLLAALLADARAGRRTPAR